MAGQAAPYAVPGGRDAVHRREVEAPGVGMVVREHIDIGPAFGAGGDEVSLAVLAGLLLGDESGNLDRADKVSVGPRRRNRCRRFLRARGLKDRRVEFPERVGKDALIHAAV
jgi:hypothetical protein